MQKRKILVLGITGMLGNVAFRYFAAHSNFEVRGTIRCLEHPSYLPAQNLDKIIYGVNAENTDNLLKIFSDFKPNIVINCIGWNGTGGLPEFSSRGIAVNSLLPHRLAAISKEFFARLIHISSDGVFSGKSGNYGENCDLDATDLYGKSKSLGELNYPHTITLRTSVIGHSLDNKSGLVSWFLASNGFVQGYKKAIFSGLPCIELVQAIDKHVFPNPHLFGVYNISSDPISKYDLLCLIARIYNKKIDIISDDKYIINRSLNSNRFKTATGFSVKAWPELVQSMFNFR
jgi:dTDP-4-dehydrorhamnose reductase